MQPEHKWQQTDARSSKNKDRYFMILMMNEHIGEISFRSYFIGLYFIHAVVQPDHQISWKDRLKLFLMFVYSLFSYNEFGLN